jgi:hypothetical protein
MGIDKKRVGPAKFIGVKNYSVLVSFTQFCSVDGGRSRRGSNFVVRKGLERSGMVWNGLDWRGHFNAKTQRSRGAKNAKKKL